MSPSGTFQTRWRSTPVSVAATSGSPKPQAILTVPRLQADPLEHTCWGDGRGKRQDNRRDRFAAALACHLRPPPGAKASEPRTVKVSARATAAVRIRRRRVRSSASVARSFRVPTPGGRCRTFGRTRRSGTDRSTRRASCRKPRRGGKHTPVFVIFDRETFKERVAVGAGG